MAKNIFSIYLLVSLIFPSVLFAADIEVQRNTADIGNSGGTQTAPTDFIAFSSLTSAFVLNSNNRENNAGSSATNGTTYSADDLSGRIELTGTDTITFSRTAGSTAADFKFAWESWEYTAAPGAANEFIVRSRNTVTLSGTESATVSLDTTPDDIDNVIPFITGISSGQTSADANSITAIAWISGTDTLNVTRGGGSTGTTIVQVVSVEFTGSNWQVAHGRVTGASADTGTITLVDNADGTTAGGGDISDWGTAVIFHQLKADSNLGNDAIADTSAAYRPGSGTTEVDWAFNANHATADDDHFVHVLRNPDMLVTRFTDTGSLAGANNVDISSAGISDLSTTASEISCSSSGTGTAYARGWKNGQLTSTTNFEHWVHRSGNTIDCAIQIIDLSNLDAPVASGELGAPQNLVTTSITGGVALDWSVPTSTGSSNLETYAIWRAAAPFSATTSATLLATFATSTGTSYSDTSVALGTTYFYRVVATNSTATSTLSNQRSSNRNNGRVIRLLGVRLR